MASRSKTPEGQRGEGAGGKQLELLLRRLFCRYLDKVFAKFSTSARAPWERNAEITSDLARSLPIPPHPELTLSALAGNHVLRERFDRSPYRRTRWFSTRIRMPSFARSFVLVGHIGTVSAGSECTYVLALTNDGAAGFAPCISPALESRNSGRARAHAFSLSLSFVPQDYASGAMNLLLRGQLEIVTCPGALFSPFSPSLRPPASLGKRVRAGETPLRRLSEGRLRAATANGEEPDCRCSYPRSPAIACWHNDVESIGEKFPRYSRRGSISSRRASPSTRG